MFREQNKPAHILACHALCVEFVILWDIVHDFICQTIWYEMHCNGGISCKILILTSKTKKKENGDLWLCKPKSQETDDFGLCKHNPQILLPIL